MASSSALWIALLATLISRWACTLSFGAPARQQPISVVRESAGLSISQQAPKGTFELSGKEKRLASRLAELGKKGDWQSARQLYASYQGSAVPVLTAAMQAAYRCARYKEAAGIYKQLRRSGAIVDKVTLLVGLKIFGKMQDPVMVDTVWAEVTERGFVDELRCGACIDAAAYMGDVEQAAAVLDVMLTRKIGADVYAFNSAIFACAKAKRPSHNAAMYLFKSLLDNGFSPTIVTFTNLARAHVKASLEQIQHVRASMKEYGIPFDQVFAESYLNALVQGRRLVSARTMQPITATLADLPEREGRLKEAQSALLEIQADNVELTALCQRFLKYAQQAGL
ncbi:unnamed protein product [Symbiodinium natans]|uniref:Pentacotripeptide-repeat region of PRORP domain-containing protein n=1 Tax=Symbiodinium natans TaxID=878477 RepID=A0A812S6N4_9DINO|nr:unnamed protein product [Symbiodinium natans]